MSLSPGERLGPYEIVGPIGAGGMGQVYRARDTRLHRDVAIKVLPPEFANDADRVKRFELEARATAALSHPNILAVYDIGRHEGVTYVAAELLEGVTLRAALAHQPVAAAKACAWAGQIALGLAAAHAKQIVHRDIKPENLFLTNDGRIKILDFGLAKSTGSSGPAAASDATMLQPHGPTTEAGVVMGTVAYMSPEQARGLPVDSRSDVFSLGVVLYEMLAGRPPFTGPSAVESMHATLTSEPPEFEPARGISVTLDRVVRRCLEKRPEDRFHSAHDLALALEAVGGSRSQPTMVVAAAEAPAKNRRTAGVAALLVLAVAASAAGTYFLTRPKSAAPLPSIQRLTFRRGTIESARFEPGTSNVVYSARWQGEGIRLFAVRSNSPESQPIGTDEAIVLSIARSQAAVLMSPRISSGLTQGTLAVMPLGGGGARPLATRIRAADFTSDGQLAALEDTGDTVRVHFPVGHVIYESKGGFFFALRAAPRDNSLAVISPTGLVILDAQGKPLRTIADQQVTGIAWTPDGGELWYSRADAPGQSTIMAVKAGGGQPREVWRGAGMILADISAAGHVLMIAQDRRGGVLVQRPDSTVVTDLSWLDDSMAFDFSPDGSAIVFAEFGDAGGSFYMRKLDGSPAIRLGAGNGMSWSPKGDAVLSWRDNNTNEIVPTGAGTTRTIAHPDVTSFFGWFADDGRLLINGRIKDQPYRFFWLDDSGATKPAGPDGIDHWIGQVPLSHDGRWLAAFPSGKNGKGGASIYPVAGGAPQLIAGLKNEEAIIRFTADDKSLLVFDRDRLPATIYKLDYRTGQRSIWRQLSPADPAGISGIGTIVVSRDERVVAYNYTRVLGTAYLISGLKEPCLTVRPASTGVDWKSGGTRTRIFGARTRD